MSAKEDELDVTFGKLDDLGVARDQLNDTLKTLNAISEGSRTAEQKEILAVGEQLIVAGEQKSEIETRIGKLNKWTQGVDHRIKELEENLPKHRASVTITQPINDKLGVLWRANYFSGWYDSEDDETYTSEVTFDLEAQYIMSSGLFISLGGLNVLNNYPDENPKSGNIGNKYGQFGPFGFDGAFWYARLGYNF